MPSVSGPKSTGTGFTLDNFQPGKQLSRLIVDSILQNIYEPQDFIVLRAHGLFQIAFLTSRQCAAYYDPGAPGVAPQDPEFIGRLRQDGIPYYDVTRFQVCQAKKS
jgi:hypothetical protein